jgi:hypothetical protein
LPPWGYNFTFNPRPANPFGDQRQGHSAFTQILPYLEQGNILTTVRLDASVIDPINLPPNWGAAPGGLSTIPVYLCPSTPGRQLDYGPFFAQSTGLNLGPMPLGATDYAVTRDIHGNFRAACAPGSPSGNVGAMGIRGQMAPDGLVEGRIKITQLTDGTSNTILVTEDAGRHQLYAKGKMLPDNQPGGKGWTLNAAWADYNTAILVRGFSNDGLIRDGGCCCINCNNLNQIYSFHTGGVNTLRGDASVQFITEGTAPGILAALISRGGGEVFNEP